MMQPAEFARTAMPSLFVNAMEFHGVSCSFSWHFDKYRAPEQAKNPALKLYLPFASIRRLLSQKFPVLSAPAAFVRHVSLPSVVCIPLGSQRVVLRRPKRLRHLSGYRRKRRTNPVRESQRLGGSRPVHFIHLQSTAGGVRSPHAQGERAICGARPTTLLMLLRIWKFGN